MSRECADLFQRSRPPWASIANCARSCSLFWMCFSFVRTSFCLLDDNPPAPHRLRSQFFSPSLTSSTFSPASLYVPKFLATGFSVDRTDECVLHRGVLLVTGPASVLRLTTQSFSLSIHSRRYGVQFSSLTPSASHLAKKATTSRPARLTSFRSRTMSRRSA